MHNNLKVNINAYDFRINGNFKIKIYSFFGFEYLFSYFV